MPPSAVESDVTAIPPSAPAPAASPVSDEADSNDDAQSWMSLTKDMTTDAPDRNIIDADNPADEAPKEAPPVVAEVPKVIEAAPIAEPPKVTETPPVVTPVVEAKKTEEVTAIPPAPEIKPADFNQVQADFIKEASKQYQLTDEQAAQLTLEPNAVLPVLAATLEANITQRLVQVVAQMVQQFVPQYTEHFSALRETTTKAEDAFFSKWGELKEHKQRVMELGRMYRQMKPQATADEFIRDVGLQAWMSVGLPVEKLAAKLQAAPVQQQPTLAAPSTPQGFAPANPGGRGPSASPTPSNPFELLTQEIIQTNH